MSKIGIGANQVIEDSKFTFALHKITGAGINVIKQALTAPKTCFFFTCELHLNDHLEKAKIIHSIIDLFIESDVEPFIFEISWDNNWNDFTLKETNNIISASQLINILREDEFH